MDRAIENQNFSLTPRQPSAVEKAEPGTKRVLSSMVADTLALVKGQEQTVSTFQSNSDQKLENWCKTGEKYLYGTSYFSPHGITGEPFAEAEKWFRMAAERGHARAQHWVGIIYETASESGAALRWCRKAAEQGFPPAQTDLGRFYFYGQGVVKDAVEAVKWFRRAAEQGDTWAKRYLGDCYQDGKGELQDFSEAVKWYRMAAEQGNHDAQFELGRAYRDGRGVLTDKIEAYKWFRLLAERDNKYWANEYAAMEVVSAKASLLPKQGLEAEQRYAEFKASHKSPGNCPTCGNKILKMDSGYACDKGHTSNVPV